MSDDVVIRAEGLGKKYLIRHGAEREPYVALRDEVMRAGRNAWRKARDFARGGRSGSGGGTTEEFWALRDVGFEVKRGEVLGIIGRNGAGKSTLLKILSRITEPSEGRVTIRGRVASLLEVGTGFHPELTGRENIYLNGAVLGMTHAEIRRKFDEIVAFAEVEKFLDTPVKRYSSGMYVRLAFAVAAHLEPEILIVDEVLAVGDAEFQKKCLGKMGEVASGGRTVLFVSHNMNAVEHLCARCIWLDQGRLKCDSRDVSSVAKAYVFGSGEAAGEWTASASDESISPVHPKAMYFTNELGEKLSGSLSNSAAAFLNIVVEIETSDPALTFGVCVYNEEGLALFWSYMTDGPESTWKKPIIGLQQYMVELPQRFFNEGAYRFEFISSLHFRGWFHPPGEGPFVTLNIQGGLSESPLWQSKRPGILAPVLNWTRHDDRVELSAQFAPLLK